MAARDRLAALRLIDRIQQHKLETIGAELAQMRAAQAEIDDQKKALARQAREEAAQSTPETRRFLSGYLATVDAQQRAWSVEQDRIEQDAVQIEAKLLEAFRTSKTNEAVIGRVARDVALEKERAETSAMDDATRALHILGQRGN